MSLKEAADIYYMSQTSALIEEGFSDLHCRSPKYLATLVWEEYKGTEPKITGLSLSVAEFFVFLEENK